MAHQVQFGRRYKFQLELHADQGGLTLKSPTKNALTFCFAIAIVFAISSHTAAQQSNGFVTVLDVAKVFKNYPPFTQKLKQIEQEATALKNKMQQQQQQLQGKAQTIVKTYNVGTPERKQAEANLEQERAKMMTDARHEQTDLLNREAKLYHTTYMQMQKVIQSYCSQSNISLVIRFESDPIDRENRGAVIKGVNRNIVYQDRMDITVAILKQMYSSAGMQFNPNAKLK